MPELNGVRIDDTFAEAFDMTATGVVITADTLAWARREEMLFERLVASWEIAGLPLDDQKLLLGRFRMADARERDWVRRTIAQHVERHIPELAP